MPLTPPEIKNAEVSRAWLRGYSRRDVDRLLEEVRESLELAYRQRADQAERLEELEAEAGKQSELEALLRSTLMSAERAAHDIKDQARRESDLIVQEAHAEGRRLTRESIAEKHEIEQEMRKIRVMLRTALDVLEVEPGEVETPAEQLGAVPVGASGAPEVGIREVAG